MINSAASCSCHEHTHDHHHHNPHEAAGLVQTFASEGISLLLMGLTALLCTIGVITAESLLRPLLYGAALLPVARLTVIDGWALWRRGDFMNEFTLMLLAAIGAFAIGEYPEAVAVLLFYSAGEKLQHRAADDVRRRIGSLAGSLPSEVRVAEPDGTERCMKPEQVTAGMVISVKPGERVAIDGVLQGDESAEFDTAAITGESVPRSVAPGASVSAGVIPIDREVKVLTTCVFTESTLSRMMRMMQEASARKTPTETLLRRVTRWFTPTVIVLALLVMAVPWCVSLIRGTHYEALMWFKRALVFFVCSCPCALVISVPLGYFAAIGAGARRGILFKGATHLDALRRVETVALDKTGTITTGRFTVEAVEGEPDTLALAAALDRASSHPLAAAITEEAGRRALELPQVHDVRSVSHGMTATLQGRPVLVGSPALLRAHGVEVALPGQVCVALDGRQTGAITLRDTIKPTSRSAVDALHRLGVKEVTVLSGDSHTAVEHAARAVGADSFSAALMPEDKYEALMEMRRKGRRTAFAGDGVNDAPSIAVADVGIAMGTLGTHMAMESADVVVAADNLEKIAEGIRLSRRAHAVVVQNILLAFSVKGAVMALAAVGIATLWAGVFADTGVTLLTILLTLLRLRRA